MLLKNTYPLYTPYMIYIAREIQQKSIHFAKERMPFLLGLCYLLGLTLTTSDEPLRFRH